MREYSRTVSEAARQQAGQRLADAREGYISPPSPGAGTIEGLRYAAEEIQKDPGAWPEVAAEAALYAGRLLADLDELAAQLGRGEWGATELGTVSNWLIEHGYDTGDEG